MNWAPGTPVEFSTGRFLVRSLRPADITQRYVDWWNDPQVMAGIARPMRRMTVEQHRQRIERQFNNRTNFHWGYFDKEKDLLVGFLTIFYTPFHKVAELNTVIGDRDYWGQEILLEMVDAGFEFLFETLGAEKLTGKAIARNLPTIFINKALGFKVEGVLRQEWRYEDGQRMDVIAFGMLREEWREQRHEKEKGKQ